MKMMARAMKRRRLQVEFRLTILALTIMISTLRNSSVRPKSSA